MDNLVEKLRSSLKVKSTNDGYLADWLLKTGDGIFKNWLLYTGEDLSKAENYITEYLNWRQRENIDQVANWDYNEEDENNMPFCILGFDSIGDVVLYLQLGKWNIRGLLSAGMAPKKIVNQFIRAVEMAMRAKNPETGLTPNNFILLSDTEEFQFTQLTSFTSIHIIREMTTIFMTRFPLYAKRVVVFRDPFYIQILWNLVKLFLSERAANRIKFYGLDELIWKIEIYLIIQRCKIPKILGGESELNYITHFINT